MHKGTASELLSVNVAHDETSVKIMSEGSTIQASWCKTKLAIARSGARHVLPFLVVKSVCSM